MSLSDNVARPYLLKGGMELHGGLVFFALLGGLAVFGGIGLVVGPLILTFLVAVLKLYRREFGGPAARADASPRPTRRPSTPAGPTRCRSNAARTFSGSGSFFQPGTSMQQITTSARPPPAPSRPGRSTL